MANDTCVYLPKIDNELSTDVILFRTKEVALNEQQKLKSTLYTQKDYGWQKLTNRTVKVHEIPGIHETVLQSPNVEYIVEDALKKFLSIKDSNKEVLA